MTRANSRSPALPAGRGAAARVAVFGQRVSQPTFGDRVLSRLFLMAIAALFAVPGGMLWDLGLNYDGVSGAMMSKIYPATYLSFAAFVLLLLTRRGGAYLVNLFLKKERSSLILLTAAGAVFAFAALDHRPGLAGLIDTFYLPVLLVIIAVELEERGIARGEQLLHLLLTCNAVLTLAEFASGTDLFPYRFEGQKLFDIRPSGLQDIAVDNAVVTGTYLVIFCLIREVCSHGV